MGQIDAAASIQVKNHSVRHHIAHAAHENPPLLITNIDVALLFGGGRNVVDETIKLEAAHLVEVERPAVGGALDGERIAFAKEVDMANVVEIEALGLTTILRNHKHPHLGGSHAKGKKCQGQSHKGFLHCSYCILKIS